MPSTIIYFVETSAMEQRDLLCRWVEHFYESGKKVQVAAESTMAAKHLDQLLWTFSQESFIPHRVVKTTSTPLEAVVVAVGELSLEGFDALVCDAAVSLDFMARFSSVVHFVIKEDSDQRQESRLLWQKAREEGFDLRHVPYHSGVVSQKGVEN
jgi:DNA polymerase III subunit chi